jgi:site-specific recombinase XerD
LIKPTSLFSQVDIFLKGSFVLLTKEVPIEPVGKMLGHKSLITTQIYVKVLDEKLDKDMEVLEKQLQKHK